MNQPTQPFANPWKDASKEDLHRTTVEIHREELSKITRVHSKQGVIQTTVYLLITKLTNELARHGLTDYDPAGYEKLVAGCVISFNTGQRSTATGTPAGQVPARATETTGGDVGYGDSGLAPALPGHAPASKPDVASGNSGSRRKRAKGKEGEQASPRE